jgi:hypothetical protein
VVVHEGLTNVSETPGSVEADPKSAFLPAYLVAFGGEARAGWLHDLQRLYVVAEDGGMPRLASAARKSGSARAISPTRVMSDTAHAGHMLPINHPIREKIDPGFPDLAVGAVEPQTKVSREGRARLCVVHRALFGFVQDDRRVTASPTSACGRGAPTFIEVNGSA